MCVGSGEYYVAATYSESSGARTELRRCDSCAGSGIEPEYVMWFRKRWDELIDLAVEAVKKVK